MSLVTRIGKIFDEFCGRGAERLEAILDGTIADGHGQMSLSPAGLSVEDQGSPLGNKIRSQVGTEQRLRERSLQTKVELIDGLEKWVLCRNL